MLIIIMWFTNHSFARTGIDALHHAIQYPAFIVTLLLSILGFQVYNISLDLISECITCRKYRIIVKWNGCADTLR